MKLWFKLGWIEWSRSLSFWHQNGSNRDFLWLTLLLALTLTLAILVWGSREGLLNRFMEVSVGYVQSAGIPIWVVGEIDEQSRVIDRELLKQIKHDGFDFHPYRFVEWDQVSLPNTSNGQTALWNAKHLPFSGWAVSANDPLWKANKAASTETPVLPLEVILSRSLFHKYFQCFEYEQALIDRMPFFQSSSSLKQDDLYCLDNGQLWLEVNTLRGRELVLFRIHWVDGRIPTMEELAFLFPVSTLYALKEARYSPQLKYYPEAQGGAARRVKTLILWQNQPNQTLRDNLANCLLANQADNASQNLILPKYPLPTDWVTQCAKHYQIPLQTSAKQILQEPYLSIAEFIEGHRFGYHNDYLTVWCENPDYSCQPGDNVVPAWKKYALVNDADKVTADMLTMIGGYQRAFIYAERQTLFEQVTKIKAVNRIGTDFSVLSLHPTYQNALLRFDFIDKIMSLLNSTYSVFFLLFLIVLLLVQIGIVIQHREHDYGIFLAKGMTWGQLCWMVCLQIVLSFLLAIIALTMTTVAAVQYILSNQLGSIAMDYQETLQLGDLELLPLLWVEYSLVCLTVLLIAVVIAIVFFVVKQKSIGQQAAHLF